MITKIISGGQTGVDRYAVDWAIENGIEYGGWIPLDRRSEDGRIPDKYEKFIECPHDGYPRRTLLNVHDSDGTLIINNGPPTGGTQLTMTICVKKKKPFFLFIGDGSEFMQADLVHWAKTKNIKTLNVAGPRASKKPGVSADHVKQILTVLFEELKK